jgi:hypothetical protein
LAISCLLWFFLATAIIGLFCRILSLS